MGGVTVQRLRVVVPPTLAELLDDPVYAAYFRRNPRMLPGVSADAPWQIIGRRAPDAPGATWAVSRVPAYADAYRRARSMMSDGRWEDVSVCSRGMLFRPPLDFEWDLRYHWCGRCRRPSLFRPMVLHPVLSSQISSSLRRAIVVADRNPRRCYYCGIDRESMPHYRARRRAQ